jgi:hypothetical protein
LRTLPRSALDDSMYFKLGFMAVLPKSKPPKLAARPKSWAIHAAVESFAIVILL